MFSEIFFAAAAAATPTHAAPAPLVDFIDEAEHGLHDNIVAALRGGPSSAPVAFD